MQRKRGSSANGVDWAIDKAALLKGGAWGPFHEIGHNHQSGDWTPAGYGEVTVNLFSCLAITEVCGLDVRCPASLVNLDAQKPRIEAFKRSKRTYDDLKRDVFLALEPYVRVVEAYGWDVFRKTFAAYHAPGFQKPKTDVERWNVFLTLMSEASGADIATPFAAWGVPVDQAVRDACAAKYPKAPESLLP